MQLKAGPHLQFTARTGPVVSTRNVPVDEAAAAVDDLLAQPYGNLHVETATEVVQVRVTKKGDAQVHRAAAAHEAGPAGHDKAKNRLVDPDDPLFRVLGAGGDKRRQVEAFVRQLAPLAPTVLSRPGDRVRAVDLGCGNAYLTFAAHRWLGDAARAEGKVLTTVGVDVREDVVATGRRAAAEAGLPGLEFAVGSIAGADPFAEAGPDGGPTWSWPCTPATPRPTKRSRGPCGGALPSSWPHRAATATSSGNCTGTAPRSSATRSCASGSPTSSPTPCARSCCSSSGTGSRSSSSSTPRTRRATR